MTDHLIFFTKDTVALFLVGRKWQTKANGISNVSTTPTDWNCLCPKFMKLSILSDFLIAFYNPTSWYIHYGSFSSHFFHILSVDLQGWPPQLRSWMLRWSRGLNTWTVFLRGRFSFFFRVDMEIWTHTSQYVLKGRYMHLSFYSYADVNMYEFEGGFALRISTWKDFHSTPRVGEGLHLQREWNPKKSRRRSEEPTWDWVQTTKLRSLCNLWIFMVLY